MKGQAVQLHQERPKAEQRFLADVQNLVSSWCQVCTACACHARHAGQHGLSCKPCCLQLLLSMRGQHLLASCPAWQRLVCFGHRAVMLLLLLSMALCCRRQC